MLDESELSARWSEKLRQGIPFYKIRVSKDATFSFPYNENKGEAVDINGIDFM